MTNIANWVEEETLTTGTGAITLGTHPIAGSTTFTQAFGAGTTDVYYSIESDSSKEAGIGSYNGTTEVLTRTTPISTLVGGVYDDTSPTPITLVGISRVRCTFNSSAFRDFEGKLEGTDSTFLTHAKSFLQGSTAAVDVGTTNVDFSLANNHELTGTATTTIGTWTFPGIGHYSLFIPSTVTVLSVVATDKKQFGDPAHTFDAGVEHIISIWYNGTVARWMATRETP